MSMRVDNSPVSAIALASQETLAAELGGDANAQVAAMMLVHARDKGTDVRAMRQTQRARVEEHHERQIEAIRNKADAEYAAARAAAYGKLAEGAGMIASGGAMTKSGGEVTSQVFAGCGKAGAAFGDGVSAIHGKKAGRLEAAAVQEEHAMSDAQQTLDELRDEQIDLQKLSRAAIDFLRDAQSAKDQVDRAAAYHRA